MLEKDNYKSIENTKTSFSMKLNCCFWKFYIKLMKICTHYNKLAAQVVVLNYYPIQLKSIPDIKKLYLKNAIPAPPTQKKCFQKMKNKTKNWP